MSEYVGDYDVKNVATLAKTRDFLGNIDVVVNDVTGMIEIFVDDPMHPIEAIVNIRLTQEQADRLGFALQVGALQSLMESGVR